jgi:hypothetical protein
MKPLQILAFMIFGGISSLTPISNVISNSPSGSWLTPPQRLPYMPDPNLTPGDKLLVTKKEICARAYGVGIRDVPTSYKNKVFAAYGLPPQPSLVIDRLISLDLGGANTIKNLWPQPKDGQWSSQLKDQLERELRRLVCNGSLDLQNAQQEIAQDWVAAYTKYLGVKAKPRVPSRRSRFK